MKYNFTTMNDNTLEFMLQFKSGITSGKVINGQLYVQRFQKLIYLHLLTELFYKDLSSIIRTNTGTDLYSF